MFIEENTSLPIKFNNIEIKSRPQAQREWKKGPHIWQCCSACQPNDTCTCPLVVRVFLQCIMLRLCHWWTYGCVCFGWFSLLWALLYCRLRYSCCVMCVCVCRRYALVVCALANEGCLLYIYIIIRQNRHPMLKVIEPFEPFVIAKQLAVVRFSTLMCRAVAYTHTNTHTQLTAHSIHQQCGKSCCGMDRPYTTPFAIRNGCCCGAWDAGGGDGNARRTIEWGKVFAP